MFNGHKIIISMRFVEMLKKFFKIRRNNGWIVFTLRHFEKVAAICNKFTLKAWLPNWKRTWNSRWSFSFICFFMCVLNFFFTFDFFSLQFGFGNNNGDFSETVLSDIFLKNTRFFAQKSCTIFFLLEIIEILKGNWYKIYKKI